MPKIYNDVNVFDAAISRYEQVFEEFGNRVYFSFSAGKDSTVMIHLALEVAERMGCLPINVMLIDLEAQYKATMQYAEKIMSRPDVNAYWICLPMHLRNAVSVYQPQWLCWDPDEKEKWIRPIPDCKGVISDVDYFDFFEIGMEFEEFVIEFGKWFAGGECAACGVGIRSDESLNRYRTMKNERKETWGDRMWTTRVVDNLYNFYPIYDWRTEDVWGSIGKNDWSYNKIYDLMYQQGKSIHECRICQPFGDDQKAGLNLFRSCEPETWSLLVDRVSGANFGNIYCKSYLMGHRKSILPDGHTWKSYTEFLLETIPAFERAWYLEKFNVFFAWWEKHGYPKDKFLDANPPKGHESLLKPDGSGYYSHTKGPSWERLVKVILKNDKICKNLSFAQTKNQYRKYNDLRDEYGE